MSENQDDHDDRNCSTCRHRDVMAYLPPCRDCIPWINDPPWDGYGGEWPCWEPGEASP